MLTFFSEESPLLQEYKKAVAIRRIIIFFIIG
jgi:hypothetical protein